MKLHCLSPYKDKSGDLFPCGRCTPCRIKRVSEWQLRLQLEANSWKHVAFVTLTYSDSYLPKSPSTGVPTLSKHDLQLFWKRLRKRLHRKIKYFACGEYGTQNKRPHYHAIIYGLDALDKSDRQAIIDSWPLCEPFIFEWKKSHNAIDVANAQCMRYVAGYVQKKLFGKDAEFYRINDIIPPFQCASQGLGLEDFLLQKNESKYLVLCPLKEVQDQFLDIFERGVQLMCPRTLLKLLKFLNKDLTRGIDLEQLQGLEPLTIGESEKNFFEYEMLERAVLMQNSVLEIIHKEN